MCTYNPSVIPTCFADIVSLPPQLFTFYAIPIFIYLYVCVWDKHFWGCESKSVDWLQAELKGGSSLPQKMNFSLLVTSSALLLLNTPIHAGVGLTSDFVCSHACMLTPLLHCECCDFLAKCMSQEAFVQESYPIPFTKNANHSPGKFLSIVKWVHPN